MSDRDALDRNMQVDKDDMAAILTLNFLPYGKDLRGTLLCFPLSICETFSSSSLRP